MRADSPSRRLPDAFALAAAVAGAVVLAALALGLTPPAAAWAAVLPGGVPFPPGAESAVVALAVVAIAFLARPTSEALAFGLVAAACMGAGLAARSVSHVVALDGVAPDARVWVASTLVADAGMFWLSGLVMTAWAAAPRRTLASWVAPVGVGLALVAVVGSILRTWASLGPASAGGATTISDVALRLSDTWRSGITIAAPAFLGLVGTMRADGRRYLARGGTGGVLEAERGSSGAFWALVGATLAAWAITLGFGEAGPSDPAGLASLLWLLIAVVAVRWSGFAAWSGLAISLVMSAEPPLALAQTQALATVDVLHPAGAPATAPLWLPSLLVGSAILCLGAWTGWRALAALTSDPRTHRLPALAVAATAVLSVAVGLARPVLATFELWAPPPGWPVPGAWTPFAVFAPIVVGAVLLLRARLVPAVAEAEAVAGDRFAPSEYLGVLAAEFVTRGAQLRSSVEAAERARLASDLHAEVLPALTQAVAASAAGAPSDRLVEGLLAVEAEVRGLVAERRHVVLEELGLVQALEWLAERTEDRAETRTPLSVELAVDPGSTDERPPRAVERAAFRIAQLAVENAVRHAHPTRIRLEILARSDGLRLRIEDDGVGLPAGGGGEPGDPGHFGLSDMRSQADGVHGSLAIDRGAAGGTAVTFGWGTG